MMLFRRWVFLAGFACALAILGAVQIEGQNRRAGEGRRAAGDQAEDDYFFARGLESKGHLDLAIDEYRKFLKRHPSHARTADVRYLLGMAAFKTKRFDLGVKALTALRDRHADYKLYPDGMYRLGSCLLELKQYEEAAKAFADASRRSPADGPLADGALYWQGESLFRAKKYDGAIAVFERLRATYPETKRLAASLLTLGYAYYHAGQNDRAVKVLDALLASSPEEKLVGEALYVRAESLLKLDRFPESAETFGRLLEKFPTHRYRDAALEGLGWSHFKHGAFAPARDAFDRRAGDASSAADVHALFLAATAAYRADDFDGTIARGTRVLAAGGADAASAAHLTGLAAMAKKDDARAVGFFQAALGKSPDDALKGKILVHAGGALQNLGKRAEAAASYDLALNTKSLGDLADDALYGAGLAYHQTGKFQLAERRLGDLVAKHGDSALLNDARFTLAENAYAAGQFKAAAGRFAHYLETARKAGAAVPREAAACYKLGCAHYQCDDFKAAADAFEHHLRAVAAADPKAPGADARFVPEVRYFLGVSYRTLDRAPDAAAQFGRCAKDHPKSEYAAKALLALGRMSMNGGQDGEALGFFDRLAREHPSSPSLASANYEAARVLMRGGDLPSAEQRLRAVLPATKDGDLASRARYNLSRVLVGQARFDEAEREAAQLAASAEGPLAAEAQEVIGYARLKAKKPAEAVEAFKVFEARHRAHRLLPYVLLNRSVAHAELAQHEDVVGVLGRLLDGHPDFPKRDYALYSRALSFEALDRKDEMAQTFRTIIAKHPESPLRPEVHYRLGEHLFAAGNFQPAAAEYAAVQSAAGAEADADLRARARYKEGWAHYKADDKKAAVVAFDQLTTEHPECAYRGEAFFQSGIACQETGDAAGGLKRFAAVVAAYPKHDVANSARVRAGECANALTKWDEAAKWFAAARKESLEAAEIPIVEHGSGVAAYELGRCDQAVQAFSVVAGRYKGPLAAECQFRIAQCREKQKDFPRAIGEYLRVSILHEDAGDWAPRAMFRAGTLCVKVKQDERARTVFRNLVKHHGKTKWAAEARRALDRLKTGEAKQD